MTKKTILSLTLAAALLTLGSCQRFDLGGLDVYGMFVSSGSHTEDRVEGWLQWNEQHGPNIIAGAPDNYSVYVCSDIHLNDSVTRIEKFLRSEQADGAALFSIVGGDISNEQGERPCRLLDSVMHLPGMTDTCFVILGNHDVYFDCEEHYRSHFHTSTYTVEVQTVSGARDLWIFTDSGNATLGRRQTQWLKELLADRDKYRHVVVNTHTCLFRNSYNYSTTPAANLPEDEYYALLGLMSRQRVNLFLMGHFHHYETHTIGGVPYVMTNNLNDKEEAPTYVVVSCGSDVTYRLCNL